jgi:hypothetical protein
MNRVRQLCATTMLMVLLTVPTAFAGNMPQGATSSPPPPVEEAVADQMATGTSSTPPSSDALLCGDVLPGVAPGINPMAESMLNLLQSLLSLF